MMHAWEVSAGITTNIAYVSRNRVTPLTRVKSSMIHIDFFGGGKTTRSPLYRKAPTAGLPGCRASRVRLVRPHSAPYRRKF